MASIIWTDVTDFAADLSAVSVDAQTDILAHVNYTLVVAHFGGEASAKTRLARIYLAAHLGKSSLPGASANGVTMESAGGLVRQYGAAGSDVESLKTTAWGKLYLSLVATSVARGPWVL